MSFWNPYTSYQSSNNINTNSNQAVLNASINQNETLSKLITSDMFNNLDCSNLSEKLTFLDESSSEHLLGTSDQSIKTPINTNKVKQPKIKQEDVYSSINNVCYFPPPPPPPPSQSHYPYYPYYFSEENNYSNYYASSYNNNNNNNNVRPSSVLSCVSTSDYNSDFDSSMSSTSTDSRRYSPNTYSQQPAIINNNTTNNKYLNYQPYNNDIPYNNYFYNHVEPNVYNYQQASQYSNIQLPVKHMPVVELSAYNQQSMHRSISCQSIVSLNNQALIKNEPKIFENQIKTKPISKQKGTNNVDGFDYPTSTEMNPNIKINLQDIDLWMQFKALGTEMVITKQGRRMFPVLRFGIAGLDENTRYIVSVDILPTDQNENRYKYNVNNGWVKVGKSEPHGKALAYFHPNSPMLGSEIMDQIVSFHKIKLTNSLHNADSMITLNSMHKYIPRLHIIEEGKSITTFNLDDCIFFAVTSYQNSMVTKLKIQHNPYAKGFKVHVYKDNEKNQKTKRPEQDQISNNLFSRQKLE